MMETILMEGYQSMASNTVSTFRTTPPVPEPSELAPEAGTSGVEDTHVYANLAEMAEINHRPLPPTPETTDEPLRSLHGGWQEYHTHAGRSYFYNAETGKCQWNPPRFLRSPAQVQAFMAANGTRRSSTEGSPEVKTECEKTPSSPREGSAPAKVENTPHLYDRPPIEGSPRMKPKTSIEMARDRRSLKCVAVPQAPTYPASMSASVSENGPSAAVARERMRSEERLIIGGLGHSASVRHKPERFDFSTSEAGHGLDDPVPPQEHAPSTPNDSSGETSCLRTIRCGNMEKTHDLSKKKEWITAYMYLTSAHLIIYKDEKSAEKHGKHYAAPLGVCDLKGAALGYVPSKDKKKRTIIEVTLSTGSRLYFRTMSEQDTQGWYEALAEVIRRLPAGAGVGMLDHSSALVRSSSLAYRGPMAESLLVEQVPSRESVIDRLLKFFRNRPSVEQLKQKGIYKHEAVFGSTLACISAQEGGALVPKFLRTVTELIEVRGLDTDGIYRVSGNLSAIQKIRCSVDQDKYSVLVNEGDVHVLSGCLKLFFRELAESVFPPAFTKLFLSAVKLAGKARLKKFDELLRELPPENRETLKHLFRHLNMVAQHSSENRMQVHNLAIVFGPTLFGSDEPKNNIVKRGEKTKGVKASGKRSEEPQKAVQSNSHLAYNLIMQGQVVEILLGEMTKLDSLKGPVVVHPPS